MEAAVTIHLTGTNSLITKDNVCAGLQKDNKAQLIIKTNNSDATAGILNARSIDGDSAGIGGGFYGSVSCSNIIIDSCSVTVSYTHLVHNFENDILVTSKNIAKRYSSSKSHIQGTMNLCLNIFDSMKKVHGCLLYTSRCV